MAESRRLADVVMKSQSRSRTSFAGGVLCNSAREFHLYVLPGLMRPDINISGVVEVRLKCMMYVKTAMCALATGGSMLIYP